MHVLVSNGNCKKNQNFLTICFFFHFSESPHGNLTEWSALQEAFPTNKSSIGDPIRRLVLLNNLNNNPCDVSSFITDAVKCLCCQLINL